MNKLFESYIINLKTATTSTDKKPWLNWVHSFSPVFTLYGNYYLLGKQLSQHYIVKMLIFLCLLMSTGCN